MKTGSHNLKLKDKVGGGAAHTIEKIVATMAKQFILIGDESKMVDHLGIKFPVPIEVIPEAMGLV